MNLSMVTLLCSVLSIHKRPVAAHGDINFPMKGWRGMVDWARSSEDRVTIPKNIVSTEKTGEHRHTKASPSCTLTHLYHADMLFQRLAFRLGTSESEQERKKGIFYWLSTTTRCCRVSVDIFVSSSWADCQVK